MTLAAFSIFIFRYRKQILDSAYKAFGYPVTPLIFISISLFLIVNTLIEEPTKAWAGIIILGIGLPFYYYFRIKIAKAKK